MNSLNVSEKIALHWGFSWIALCLAFAAHVFDEAIHNFLSFYNPVAASMREAFSLLPLPVFNVKSWLTLLILIILVLLSLSIFAFQPAKWMKPLSYIFLVIMFINGLLHIIGSIVMGMAIPGVISSPLLLLAAVYLFVIVRRVPS
jgi:hypothetical protein